MEWYRRFLSKNGMVGLLMSLYAIGYILMIVMRGILSQPDFEVFALHVTLPVDIPTFVKAPWTLFTYWMFTEPFWIWILIVDMMLLYTFGNILNAMLGDRRTQGTIFFAILVNGILTVCLVNLLPTVEVSVNAPLFGLQAVNATLIAAAITLVPNYKMMVFRWEVKLWQVGAIMLFIMGMGYRLILTTQGTGIVVGALVGFTIIKVLQTGNDLTSWFQFNMGFETHNPRTGLSNPRIRVVQSTSGSKKEAVVKEKQSSKGERLDQLLDKINEVGYQNLSRKEKEELDKLSDH